MLYYIYPSKFFNFSLLTSMTDLVTELFTLPSCFSISMMESSIGGPSSRVSVMRLPHAFRIHTNDKWRILKMFLSSVRSFSDLAALLHLEACGGCCGCLAFSLSYTTLAFFVMCSITVFKWGTRKGQELSR